MRAIVVREYGGPEVLHISEVPTPSPGPGQLRIKVAAAAVNPVDVVTRDGTMTALGGITEHRAAVGLGWDVAGTVDALGDGVEGPAVGTEVIGLHDVLDSGLGPYAEYLVFDAAAFAPAPRAADLVAAATLPMNALTADQALDVIGLRPGQTLLVPGAAGAVGGYVVELGARRGLHVVAVASASDEALVRAWGARTFLPRSGDLTAAVRATFPGGVDGAIDAAVLPGETLAAVRDGGVYVTLTPYTPPSGERGISVRAESIHHDGARLGELARLVDEGALTLRVAATFPLDEARAAHELLAKGGIRGRIVLVP
jgi:NADPH:quinone reductase-like Zn-dependent oxidoreductase